MYNFFVIVGTILYVLFIAFMFNGTKWLRAYRLRLEYWVEHVSPGILRGENDDVAFAYHEGTNVVIFLGKFRKHRIRDVIFVPNAEQWERTMPEWVIGRRDVVLVIFRAHIIFRSFDFAFLPDKNDDDSN
jgi:hypothetical protein